MENLSVKYEYESNGKLYSGEKACISLTSWKKRINTVSKTLYSIIKMCPDFHIVLVLSKDEFTNKEKDLPEDLNMFIDSKLIELLWIKPNFKSFKKIIFTMDKYRNIPVISSDDDCIYTKNYAQELYDVWLQNKSNTVIYCYLNQPCYYTFGPATLHSPLNFKYILNDDVDRIENLFCGDDDYYTHQYFLNNVKIVNVLYNNNLPFVFSSTSTILNIPKNTNKKIGYDEIMKLCFNKR